MIPVSGSSSALRTKKALAAALKARMQTTPFAKITVSDLVSDCGLNRKTFYYHFDDIYALLKWLFEEEAIDVARQFDVLVDYEECVAFSHRYIDENRAVLRSAYDSVGRDVLKDFFYTDFSVIVDALVTANEEQLGKTLPAHLKTLFCDFLTENIASMLINDIAGHYDQDRDTLTSDLATIVGTSVTALIKEHGE